MMKQFFVGGAVLLLSACSAQISSIQVRGDGTSTNTVIRNIERPMFVRGDFTLWDADPIYQLRSTTPGVYQVRVKWTTPGKVYEFKIADADWTEGYNCGYANDGKLMLGQASAADCNTVYNYFSFTPERKGMYVIELDYRNPRLPLVTVKQG